jgi:hypothetical protein
MTGFGIWNIRTLFKKTPGLLLGLPWFLSSIAVTFWAMVLTLGLALDANQSPLFVKYAGDITDEGKETAIQQALSLMTTEGTNKVTMPLPRVKMDRIGWGAEPLSIMLPVEILKRLPSGCLITTVGSISQVEDPSIDGYCPKDPQSPTGPFIRIEAKKLLHMDETSPTRGPAVSSAMSSLTDPAPR